MILFGNMFVLSFQNFWYKFVGAEWSTEKKVCNHRALPSFLRECKTNLCLAITSKTSENAFKRDLPRSISCVPWGVRGSTFKRLFLNDRLQQSLGWAALLKPRTKDNGGIYAEFYCKIYTWHDIRRRFIRAIKTHGCRKCDEVAREIPRANGLA